MIDRKHDYSGILDGGRIRMVMPRAEVELNRDPDYPKVYYAKCVKCGGIIGDDTAPLEVSGLKPECVKSYRIMCHHYVGKKACKHLNFVSHK